MELQQAVLFRVVSAGARIWTQIDWPTDAHSEDPHTAHTLLASSETTRKPDTKPTLMPMLVQNKYTERSKSVLTCHCHGRQLLPTPQDDAVAAAVASEQAD